MVLSWHFMSPLKVHRAGSQLSFLMSFVNSFSPMSLSLLYWINQNGHFIHQRKMLFFVQHSVMKRFIKSKFHCFNQTFFFLGFKFSNLHFEPTTANSTQFVLFLKSKKQQKKKINYFLIMQNNRNITIIGLTIHTLEYTGGKVPVCSGFTKRKRSSQILRYVSSFLAKPSIGILWVLSPTHYKKIVICIHHSYP